MPTPTVRDALGLGWRAAVENAWLAPVGLVAALGRIALYLPAVAFAVSTALGRGGRAHRGGFGPSSVVPVALEALVGPGTVAVLVGLWATAALLGAAIHAAYLAGALPTMGRTLAGRERDLPVFATGLAYGFPRLAATAFLAWLVELVGAGFAWAALAGSLAISLRARDLQAGVGTAAVVAAALTCAALVPLVASTVADAALGRAALQGDDPARALANAVRRLARRPAAFLAAALAVALFGALAVGSIRSVASLATGFARGPGAWVLLGADLVVAVTASLVAAWVELWRLGAVATLACAEEPG